MADRPLILFAEPQQVPKEKGHGGPPNFAHPTYAQQVERLSPKFNALRSAWEGGKISIKQLPDGIEPEYTLVLEVAGDPSGFETAVRNLDTETKGAEWLFEVVDDSVPNDDYFYSMKGKKSPIRDDTKTMSFKYFCILTNLRALEEILSLWNHFQSDVNYKFPTGKTGLRNVFSTLRDIHVWGAQERLEETEILEVWVEDLNDPDATDVKCEIELFFRRSSDTRAKSQKELEDYITSIGGSIVASSCIEAIGYHALLASIPREYAERIIRREHVELVSFGQIMFFKPTGQSIVLGTADGFEYQKSFAEPRNIMDEPVIALFDGLPQERHPLLNGLLSIDDPDDYTSSYQIVDRQHGTSMASLIARGDLLDEEHSLISCKIYVRPIMKPYPNARDTTTEFLPDEVLIVDKIHEAVRRLYEPEAGRVAPTVRVINLSIGIGARMYYNMISPFAKLLDWLSYKYRVLFIVSAGNHNDDIDLDMTFDEFKALDSNQRDAEIIKLLNQNARNLRLLSPAESMNSLTVGALFADESDWSENSRQILPCSSKLPSPISSLGRGINKSIKPDILYPGGRSFLLQDMRKVNKARWRDGISINPPGILSAKPVALAGGGSRVGYSFGTSDATALITHKAAICFDVLNDIFSNELNTSIPAEYAALLLKAMLVHGAKWDEVAATICRTLGVSGRGADQIHKWLGYGTPDVSRVQECAKNRVTLIGYGELSQDSACMYTLPLPFNFSTQKMYRCLTVTLASFTPIRPTTQKYRSAQLWYNIETNGKKLVPARQDADDKAVIRGTLQHERYAGDGAVVWGEDDFVGIKISCRADANDFVETVPYAILATFEIAPEHNVDVYQKVFEKVKPREAVTPV